MARYTLTIPQGATWAMSWPITEDGDPLDLSLWAARSQVRTPDRAVVLHEWSTVLGNASVANSAVTLVVTPAVSAAWTWHTGIYDVELLAPSGEVYRISEGFVCVSPEVTR